MGVTVSDDTMMEIDRGASNMLDLIIWRSHLQLCQCLNMSKGVVILITKQLHKYNADIYHFYSELDLPLGIAGKFTIAKLELVKQGTVLEQ